MARMKMQLQEYCWLQCGKKMAIQGIRKLSAASREELREHYKK